MTRALIRFGQTLLLSGLIIAALQPASAAGTFVQIAFYGSNFSGCLQYDQSQPKASPHFFNFTGSPLNHEICYQVNLGAPVKRTAGGCEPYTIHTSLNSNRTFQLQATAPATTSVLVTIPGNIIFDANQLPFCTSGTTHVFQNAGTFTLANTTSGLVTFTGTILAVTCKQSTTAMDCPCPPPPIGIPAPALPSAQAPVEPVAYPTTYAAPYPVYACEPRPACCLTRLFARRSRCHGCW
jgi:hypothetical protein